MHPTDDKIKVPDIFKPKDISYYEDLTDGGNVEVQLSQEQAYVVLKVHDYGVDALAPDEKDILHAVVGKLKDQIWP